MWIDDLKPGESWTLAWHHRITCGNCDGIFDIMATRTCPVCNYTYIQQKRKIHVEGNEVEIPHEVFAGAILWTTYTLLRLMQAEWERPINEEMVTSSQFKTSPRAVIVILFWTQFANLIDQLLQKGMQNVPLNISEHLLKRNQQISTRIDTLYPLVFNSKFNDDLATIGYPHLIKFLSEIQEKRNIFIHKNPEIIDSELVLQTIKNLQDVQLAWISLYNLKCTKIQKKHSILEYELFNKIT